MNELLFLSSSYFFIGIGWYKSFIKRHPNISVRTSEHVTAASACISEQDIKKWFEGIKQYLKEEGLFDILSDPTRIFNGDETGFSLCPKTKAVLTPKGCKDVYKVGNSKENYLLCLYSVQLE